MGIPPAYFRPGRWDSSPFYVGLPTEQVKTKILEYYISKFDLTKKQIKETPKMVDWTGAEIEALCHNASMRDLSLMEASQFVLAMAAVAKEDIQALEKWAKGRTINAEKVPAVKSAVSAGKRKVDL
jgi:SpoVK/Ycf46/Vps4 family AAA+-type ATPase